jgi:hypothetical protein
MAATHGQARGRSPGWHCRATAAVRTTDGERENPRVTAAEQRSRCSIRPSKRDTAKRPRNAGAQRLQNCRLRATPAVAFEFQRLRSSYNRSLPRMLCVCVQTVVAGRHAHQKDLCSPIGIAPVERKHVMSRCEGLELLSELLCTDAIAATGRK